MYCLARISGDKWEVLRSILKPVIMSFPREISKNPCEGLKIPRQIGDWKNQVGQDAVQATFKKNKSYPQIEYL